LLVAQQALADVTYVSGLHQLKISLKLSLLAFLQFYLSVYILPDLEQLAGFVANNCWLTKIHQSATFPSSLL
jgi:hypothetical protein